MISNLSDLSKQITEKLQTNKLQNLNNLLHTYSGTDWKQFIHENKKKYHKKLIFQNKLMDIYIITWSQNQESPIHNHAKGGCLHKILQGELIEDLYDHELNKIHETKLKTNQIHYIDDTIGFHKIKNNQKQSVSLHIYSPSKFKTNYY